MEISKKNQESDRTENQSEGGGWQRGTAKVETRPERPQEDSMFKRGVASAQEQPEEEKKTERPKYFKGAPTKREEEGGLNR